MLRRPATTSPIPVFESARAREYFDVYGTFPPAISPDTTPAEIASQMTDLGTQLEDPSLDAAESERITHEFTFLAEEMFLRQPPHVTGE